MKSWVIDGHGRDRLRVEEAPIAEPRQGEVRARVAAVALNARDLMMIDHGMELDLRFPFVPASDETGSADAVGDGVSRLRLHDRAITSFLPDWIDGQPRGSAEPPSYRTQGGSSSDDKLERAKALGARHSVNRNTQDLVAEVYRITAGRAADHVWDLIGGGATADRLRIWCAPSIRSD